MNRAQSIAVSTVIASVLVVGAVVALLITQTTIDGGGSIKAVGLGVYWDSACTNATSTLDFGQLEPGASSDFTLYLRNEGNSALTLSMTTDNWVPGNAPDYLTLTWNREGQLVDPDEVMSFVLTLTAAADAQDINSFSLDIIISGAG